MSDNQANAKNGRRWNLYRDADVEIVKDGLEKRILAYDNDLMVEELKFKAGVISNIHTHTPVQMPYVKSGVFEFQVNEDIKILHEGDVAYMAAGEPHCVKCIEDGTLVVAFSPAREDYIKR